MNNFILSPLFCMYNNVTVLEQNSETIIIGIWDVDNDDLKSKITKSFLMFEGDLPRKLIYKQISKEECKKLNSKKLAENAKEIKITEKEESKYFTDAPAVNFLEALFIECIEDKAVSDIHFEPFYEEYRIRLRRNGDLEFYKNISRELFYAISRRIKLLCNVDSGNYRQIQDGSFFYTTLSLKASFRASFIPVFKGESLVLRLLRCEETPPNLEDLGFTNSQIRILKQLISKKSSLLLICGATGAGKTTTLAALLTLLKNTNQKIITIEDPVEYFLPGVSQVQVSPELDLNYQQVLRSSFRHDPDVLMIGEIRDEETAKIAIRGALTGHLVLATLHTKDSSSAISRLLDLGVKPFLLASVLGAVLAQRLIKTETGNRMAVGEILESSKEVKELIMEKAPTVYFDEYLFKKGINRIWEE